jgi:PhnB protein
MSIQTLNPYLNFDGTGAKAIELYERALGAKTENLMLFGDIPGMDIAAADRGRVMHARLHIGGGVVMISDSRPGMAVPAHTNVHVALHFTDNDDMQKKFDALAVGGKVTMPLEDMFWGARFGMLTDAFHISWMFSCEKKG